MYSNVGFCPTYQGSHSTGETGKIVKSNSRQGKHREFQNFGKTQGRHREFENFKVEIWNQESTYRKRMLRDVNGFIFDV